MTVSQLCPEMRRKAAKSGKKAAERVGLKMPQSAYEWHLALGAEIRPLDDLWMTLTK